MVEWAAQLLTRFVVKPNGKTAYQTIKGHTSHKAISAFGESVLYKPNKSSSHTRAKMGDRFLEGVWLGLCLRSDENIIGTPEGVVKARTVRRRPFDEAWNAEAIISMRGTLEFPVPGRKSDHIPSDVHLRPGHDGIPEEDVDCQGPEGEGDPPEQPTFQLNGRTLLQGRIRT